jgi:holo-[acyl-carrier protein] synthase
MHLAARLAAKEASFKALTGSDDAKLIGWKEAEVRRGSEGPPVLYFFGRAESRSQELGVTRVHLTLSHTDETAGAIVILER